MPGSDPGPPDPVPETIGKYRVVRRLGQGAMGEVYLAEAPFIARPVAVKVLKGAGAEDRQRFVHEAQVVGSLAHPNIVVLHDFGFHEGRPFLVLEYLQGRGLDSWLLEPHPLQDHLKVASGLCSALLHAHDRGVLHRDLKPQNVHVMADGACKLMDFGIAHTADARLTATGTVMGTPAYLAPETLTDAAYSVRTDVYAAGLVVYEMLAGTNPFLATTIPATLNRILTIDPVPLARVRPDVPRELADAVMSCLERRPERRPADLRTLQDALYHGMAPGTLVVATHSVIGLPRPPTPARVSVRRWAVPAAGLAAVVAGALVAIGRPPATAPPPSAAAPAPTVAIAPPPVPATTLAAPPSVPRAAATPGPPEPLRTRRAGPASLAAEPAPSVPPFRVDAAPAAVTASTLAAVAVPGTPAPAPAPHELALQAAVPATTRRGLPLVLRLRGSGFHADQQARVLRGRQPAVGIRVTRLRALSPTEAELTLLVDADAPLGVYSIVVSDGDGASNPVTLEVVL